MYNLEETIRRIFQEELSNFYAKEVKAVYLCGAMDYLSDKEMGEWRDYATKKLKEKSIIVYDPRYISTVSNKRTTVVEDLTRIDKSDVVLVNFSQKFVNSSGTSMEIFYQSKIREKIVVLFTGDDREVHDLPIWISVFSPVVVKDIDKALDYIFGLNDRHIKREDKKDDKKDEKK